MQTFLRALRLYAMVAWVGGLAFFAFVVAPVAFGSLPSAHEAGIVVGGTLRVLHWIGLIGGVVFCMATGWLWLGAEVPARIGFMRQLALTTVMLLVTAYSQFRVLPAMEVDRARPVARWRRHRWRMQDGWTSSGCIRCRSGWKDWC